MKDGRKSDKYPEERSENKLNRRELMLGAGGAATVGLAATAFAASAFAAPTQKTTVFPVYYPRPAFTPEIDLTGKFAVVTGASRGIGRATAEALVAQGVTVVGTSRDATNAPNPPTSFTLLDLDITSDASVSAFAATLAGILGGNTIDILINNAGRFILGFLVPPPLAPDPDQFYIDQLNLGMETLYQGHIRVTNKLLPLMTPVGYARVLYTVSVAGYLVGGGAAGAAQGVWGAHAYYSGKGALRVYANNLRTYLGFAGSNIKVSTVNPFLINTELAEGLNPVYTEPVDANGDSSNPVFQAGLTATRTSLQNGLPASDVADTYLQLLTVNEPLPNVVVGTPIEPGATAGGNALFLTSAEEENEQSAMHFAFGVPGC